VLEGSVRQRAALTSPIVGEHEALVQGL